MNNSQQFRDYVAATKLLTQVILIEFASFGRVVYFSNDMQAFLNS